MSQRVKSTFGILSPCAIIDRRYKDKHGYLSSRIFRLYSSVGQRGFHTDTICRQQFPGGRAGGCALSLDGPTHVIIIVNWQTGKFAKINTGIEVKVTTFPTRRMFLTQYQLGPLLLTALTTKDRLLLSYDGTRFMLTWWYELDSLRRCIAQAGSQEDPCIIVLSP